LASSIVYILNDLADVERDRLHPIKSQIRPLASGAITRAEAWLLLAGLATTLGGAGIAMPRVMLVIAGYLALNVAYTLKLKHVAVVDIFCIAIGFVLRVYAGATAMMVPVSHWMFITTLCLALYLAAIKRRQELKNIGSQGREVLGKYSRSIVDRYAMLSSTGALIFYSMFVMSSRPGLMVTIPIVLFGLFRYWYLVDELDEGESPTDVLYSDGQILLTVAVWIAACAWIVAGQP
jgi:4-hydroxybenzoate polyprenyltransferase